MSEVLSRPKNPFTRPAHSPADPSFEARRGRRAGFRARLQRRIRAQRDIDILSPYVPGAGDVTEECLLLVHVRKVVGQISYRTCTACAEGVITAVDIDEPYHSSRPRLNTRVLSHLRFRHPHLTWHDTTAGHSTRNLLHRLSRVTPTPAPTPSSRCLHTAGADVDGG
ncbi:hypothetical protein ACFWUZ_30135 [Streptomyces sp. NPDC058646]|uniref:hypothetical protein n=1 Tax=Streptomyces sp. NPDC058646 TaxID=3346574 RepID=UPI00364E4521